MRIWWVWSIWKTNYSHLLGKFNWIVQYTWSERGEVSFVVEAFVRRLMEDFNVCNCHVSKPAWCWIVLLCEGTNDAVLLSTEVIKGSKYEPFNMWYWIQLCMIYVQDHGPICSHIHMWAFISDFHDRKQLHSWNNLVLMQKYNKSLGFKQSLGFAFQLPNSRVSAGSRSNPNTMIRKIMFVTKKSS